MTPGGNNFNDFPENQLTKFSNLESNLPNIVHHQGLGAKPPSHPPETKPMQFRQYKGKSNFEAIKYHGIGLHQVLYVDSVLKKNIVHDQRLGAKPPSHPPETTPMQIG